MVFFVQSQIPDLSSVLLIPISIIEIGYIHLIPIDEFHDFIRLRRRLTVNTCEMYKLWMGIMPETLNEKYLVKIK